MRDGFKWTLWIGAVIAGMLLAGCAPIPEPVPPIPARAALEKLGVDDYPSFSDQGQFEPLLLSMSRSLAYLDRLPDDRVINFGNDPYPVLHLRRSMNVFSELIRQEPTAEQINTFIRNHFHVYQSIGREVQKDVLFTGYYEPLLEASLRPTPQFRTPVHSKPRDMVEIDLSPFAADLKGRTIIGQYTGQTVIPYPSRKQIRLAPDFNEAAPPVVWLRDDIDLLNLQIQGSGRVRFEDGSQLHILFDGSNGRPYRSVGKLLINEGRISPEQMSMQAIRAYLKQHPKIKNRIMDHNPRYIFFRSADSGPFGALGQPLTPMRSVAADLALMPRSALAYITVPVASVGANGDIVDWQTHSGFALCQDAGSAIKGPGRIDLFVGHGLEAEVAAGHLKHPGEIYFLVLKPDSGLGDN